MKKDIEDKNSIENSTLKTNVGDYTSKLISAFSTLNQKINKKMHVTRWCFNDTKEKGNKIEYSKDSKMNKIKHCKIFNSMKTI